MISRVGSVYGSCPPIVIEIEIYIQQNSTIVHFPVCGADDVGFYYPVPRGALGGSSIVLLARVVTVDPQTLEGSVVVIS